MWGIQTVVVFVHTIERLVDRLPFVLAVAHYVERFPWP